jgi:2-keto-4-pentenoate hydratase/2-oxohepta-3-ene-1,7-dioic acid hydratase in catechol pathway
MRRFAAIIGIGQNYAAHAKEMGSPLPEWPVVFYKNPAAVIGHGDAIVIPEVCAEKGPQVDYEVELGLVVGQDCTAVAEAEALATISHYCVANDVSARWWQKKGAGGQFCRGKSFDTFCPVGELVPACEVADPQALTLKSWVNGELRQDSCTDDMIFSVARLIAELTRGMTLLANTLILTGTPAGVGAGRRPPQFLQAGDEVRVAISGLGELCNPVVAAV